MNEESTRSSQETTLPLDAPADEEALRRPRWLALLRGRYHWAILLAVLLGGGLGALGYFAIPPMYQSTSTVRISPELRKVLYATTSTDPIRDYEAYLEFQGNLLKSKPVVDAAIGHETWQQLNRATTTLEDRAYFRERVTVEIPDNQQIIEVSFTDASPAIAGAGAQAIAAAYKQVYGQQHTREESQILRKLRDRAEQLGYEINQHQREKQRTAGSYGGVAGLDNRYEYLLNEKWRVESMLRQIQMQLAVLEGEEGEAPLDAGMNIPDIAAQDGHMRQLLQQRQLVENRIQHHTDMGLGENHRSQMSARAERDALNRQIEQYARQYQASGGGPTDSAMAGGLLGLSSPEALRSRQQELQQYQQEVQGELQAIADRQATIRDLDDKIEVAKQNLLQASAQTDKLQFEPSAAERVSIIDLEGEPESPHNTDKRVQLAGVGGLFGASLGVGLVMLMGLLSRRFRGIDDAHDSLPTTPLLGILPTLPDQLEDPEQATVAAHCVHRIRALLQIGADDEGRVFAVTSPAPGSGKTSLCTALGLSFASSEAKTLLIDCDMIGAGLTRRMNIQARQPLERMLRSEGFVNDHNLQTAQQQAKSTQRRLEDVLIEQGYVTPEQMEEAQKIQEASLVGLLEACDGTSFDDCVISTDIDNLSVLPVGSAIPQHAGSLSPAALRRLLAQARSRFDIILIDTGPILGSIEASMSSAEADGTILVVSRGDEKAMVHRSLDTLRSVRAHVAGIVFNHASDDDVERSSYASVTSNPARNVERVNRHALDPTNSERFGPVGSAVASSSRSRRQRANRNGHQDQMAAS